MDPVPDPTLPEKFLGYSRESNPGPLGWQSDVLTTIYQIGGHFTDLKVFNLHNKLEFGILRKYSHSVNYIKENQRNCFNKELMD